MKDKILQYLLQVESEYNIKILLACETGSRAWGFPSPDSDYDIRFIYKHKRDWYLNLHEQKDSIERMYENKEFDLSGWDLKKSLNLLWKSNPPLIERIQSPIVYISDNNFLLGLNVLAQNSYSKIATMHHYLSMSKKIYSEIKEKDNVKLKNLFYAIRTATACKWIEETEELPPIVFQIMLNNLALRSELKQQILDLIELKATKNEDYLHHQEPEINFFIENCINKAEKIAKSLAPSNGNIEKFNSFFKNQLL